MPVSGTAGVFTCAMLLIATAKIDAIWADNQRNQDYVAQVGVLTALRNEQTATLTILENPTKDRELKVMWIADCSTGVEDCDGEDCVFTGPEAEAKCKEYALDICTQVSFSIEENMFRVSEFSKEETLAIQFLARLKELDEDLAQRAVAKLNTFAGTNQFTGGIGSVNGVTTYIAPNFWGPDMFGYFAQTAIINKLKNVFLIHGSNLFQANWQAAYNVANANQAADKPKLGSIRSYWDLFNIDLVNSPDMVSYMLSKGSVAFASKTYYPLNSPVDYDTFKRWSIASKSLPGVNYDVFYKIRCVGEQVFHDYKIKAKAGIFLNPFGCNEDVTGVLKFVCGVDPGES